MWCCDGVYICKSCHSKVKKNKVSCHAVPDKLLDEWSPRELQPPEAEDLSDWLETVLAARRTLL